MKLKAFRYFAECIHLAAQPEQMNWNDGADLLSGFCFPCATRIDFGILLYVFPNRGWTNVVRFGVNIGEQRSRADARDASGGRKKCVGCRDNGIAPANSKR